LEQPILEEKDFVAFKRGKNAEDSADGPNTASRFTDLYPDVSDGFERVGAEVVDFDEDVWNSLHVSNKKLN